MILKEMNNNQKITYFAETDSREKNSIWYHGKTADLLLDYIPEECMKEEADI